MLKERSTCHLITAVALETPTCKHTHAETFGGIEYQVLHFSESLRAGIEVSTPANAHKKCGILRFWTRKLLSDGKSRMKVECFPPLERN